MTYCIVPADAGYVSRDVLVAAVEEAFSAWGVPTVDKGGCDALTDADGVNEIGWGDLSSSGSSGPGVYEAGLTTMHYSECTSGCDRNDLVHIVEADITLEADPPRAFRNRRCLYSTVLHETGHFLGLEHLPPPAVMAAETATCVDALTDSDLQALLERYGPVAQPAR